MTRRYGIVLTPEPDGSALNVTSPDIPDLVTFGHPREKALATARDRAAAPILTDLAVGDEIPGEGGRAELGTIEIEVDALHTRPTAEKSTAITLRGSLDDGGGPSVTIAASDDAA